MATVDIRVSKTSPNPTLRRGQVTTGAFLIRVQNAGPGDATNVRVYDVTPSGVAVTGWTATNTQNTAAFPPDSPVSGGAAGTGGFLTTIPNLPAGSHVDFLVDVQASLSATLGTYDGTALLPQNLGYALPSAADSSPSASTGANIGRSPFEIRAVQVDVDLVKTFSNPSPEQGDVITMTLQVRNFGATDVVGSTQLTDELPTWLAPLSWSATYTGGATGAASGTSFPIGLGNLPAGSSATVTVQLKVARCAPLEAFNNVAQLCLPVGFVTTTFDKPCVASAPAQNGTPGTPTTVTPQKHVCVPRIPIGGAGVAMCPTSKVAGMVTVELVNPAGGPLYLDCDVTACGLDAPQLVTCGVYATAMFDANGCWETCPLPRTTDFLSDPSMCTDAARPEPFYRVTINQQEIDASGRSVGGGTCAVYELRLPGSLSMPVVPVVTYGTLVK